MVISGNISRQGKGGMGERIYTHNVAQHFQLHNQKVQNETAEQYQEKNRLVQI